MNIDFATKTIEMTPTEMWSTEYVIWPVIVFFGCWLLQRICARSFYRHWARPPFTVGLTLLALFGAFTPYLNIGVGLVVYSVTILIGSVNLIHWGFNSFDMTWGEVWKKFS